jgi:phospholipase C
MGVHDSLTLPTSDCHERMMKSGRTIKNRGLNMKHLLAGTCSALIATAALIPSSIADDFDRKGEAPLVTEATSTDTVGAQEARKEREDRDRGHDHERLSLEEKIRKLRQKVKYVFVLFQENRSFDHYFGTYPGANGLYSTYPGANPADPKAQPANATASFTQNIWNTDGTFSTISPFLIPRTVKDSTGHDVQLYPEDTFSVDHSHTGMVFSAHYDAATQSQSKNDAYVLDEEGLRYSGDASTVATIVKKNGAPVTGVPSLAAKQEGELMLAHVDCDTIPFLWQYADRFTLFDNFHQTTIGPSTPNAIAMIAGQTGETQWALHPSAAVAANAAHAFSIPNENDNAPFAGGSSDTSPSKPPYGPDEESFAAGPVPPPLAPAIGTTNPPDKLTGPETGPSASQANLTFATLPLSFMGDNVKQIIKSDPNPAADLLDVQDDIATIARQDDAVHWGWYQQGFGPEPFDGSATIQLHPATTPHPSYIVHHNGPQYFGYLADNPQELSNMHSLQQFYTDIANHALPDDGGVFYVRGGFYNNDNLTVLDPNPNVRATFPGNDDHPAYSDAQISEANIADSVNAIAKSDYWKDSAIIITYDETDGLYDHVPETIRSWDPSGTPLTGGPRIPAIVISPYSRVHAVSHVYSEHSSVIKFINELFDLVPLADLPDEVKGRTEGAANPALNAPDGAPQTNLGPADDKVAMGDLLEAFDDARLDGRKPPLPADYAIIPDAVAHTLPQYGGAGCTALKITPTDYPNGYAVGAESDPPPADFNPRATVSPGIPTQPGWPG